MVIPARYASTRLPGKPLLRIGGRPMVVCTAQRAAASGAAEVVVATDDVRIAQAAAAAGFQTQITAARHPSGSDRVSEVAQARGWPEDAILINLQGDEPLAPPAIIAQLAQAMAARPGLPMATLCAPITDLREFEDPNVVKVVRSSAGLALYFSRAPIPAARDGDRARLAGLWRRHIGLYAYRVAELASFVALPPSPLETLERLEQLRALENGLDILVLDACRPVPGGVDTAQDLALARRRYQVLQEDPAERTRTQNSANPGSDPV